MSAMIVRAVIKLSVGKSLIKIINTIENNTMRISSKRLASIKAISSKPLGLYILSSPFLKNKRMKSDGLILEVGAR